MTEQEWLECTDPQAMLVFLEDKASPSKLRLFTRMVWVHNCSRLSRAMLDLLSVYLIIGGLGDLFSWGSGARLKSTLVFVSWLRDMFGNPFRPVSFDRALATFTIKSLAQAIHDEKAFDRMPILADALEEAGVAHPDLLNHCRQPGDHVKGCWALDLVLGKE